MDNPSRTLSSAHSDAVLARASQLHDAAFADPAVKRKPSWEDSLALAEEEAAAPKTPSTDPTHDA